MTQWLSDAFGDVSLTAISLVLASVAVGGFLRGFLGFAGSIVIIMVTNVVINPQFAIPLACLAGIPSAIQMLPDAMRYSDRTFALPFGFACVLMVPIGTLVLVRVDPALMKILISFIVLLMAVLLYRGVRVARSDHIALTFGAGMASGLVQGAAGVGGPLAVALAMAMAGTTEKQRANVIAAVGFLSLTPLVPLWLSGMFTQQVVYAAILATPVYVAATWVGRRYFSGQGRAHYRDAALLALSITAMVTMVIAVRDYLAQ